MASYDIELITSLMNNIKSAFDNSSQDDFNIIKETDTPNGLIFISILELLSDTLDLEYYIYYDDVFTICKVQGPEPFIIAIIKTLNVFGFSHVS